MGQLAVQGQLEAAGRGLLRPNRRGKNCECRRRARAGRGAAQAGQAPGAAAGGRWAGARMLAADSSSTLPLCPGNRIHTVELTISAPWQAGPGGAGRQGRHRDEQTAAVHKPRHVEQHLRWRDLLHARRRAGSACSLFMSFCPSSLHHTPWRLSSRPCSLLPCHAMPTSSRDAPALPLLSHGAQRGALAGSNWLRFGPVLSPRAFTHTCAAPCSSPALCKAGSDKLWAGSRTSRVELPPPPRQEQERPVTAQVGALARHALAVLRCRGPSAVTDSGHAPCRRPPVPANPTPPLAANPTP